MPRLQGTNSDGELMSSSIVEIDRSNPAISVDFTNTVSLTRQEFADECDINNLMAQYEKTGILPLSMNNNVPQFLDVTGIPDYRETLDLIRDAEAAFMALPAVVRKEFDNDPIQFIEFAKDPENLPQMRTWGLAPEEVPEPPPQKVELVNSFVPEPPQDAPGPVKNGKKE